MENYEQKYKKALEIAREIYNRQDATDGGKIILESMFPELKESEDERIRKKLIEVFTKADNIGGIIYSGDINYKEAISWLEKQGEKAHKARFKVGDKVIWIRDSRATVRTISEVSKSNTYWLDCPGSSSGWYSDDELVLYIEQGEQKPLEWNEDDEDAIDIAIRIIQNKGDDCAGILDADKALNWLKSIKPQPKYQWTDEDEKNLKDLLTYGETKLGLRGWIAGLPEKLGSRSGYHWKPSEEQMQMLHKFTVPYSVISNYDAEFFKSFYNELKELQKMTEKK